LIFVRALIVKVAPQALLLPPSPRERAGEMETIMAPAIILFWGDAGAMVVSPDRSF